MECYERLRKFVSDMDIEDENVYYDIRNMIEVKKLHCRQQYTRQ